MVNNFKKIKTKFTIETLIIALFVGLFSGVLVSSILVLIYKQLGLEYNLLLFILIGVGVFVLLSLIIFLIFKPNNIKVAKRIDRQLNLKEKVHTMVEYEGKNGYLIDMQRADTKDKLNNLKVKRVKMKFSLYLLILPVVALALCLSSIMVKGKEVDEPVVVEPPVSGDPYIIAQLRDLIREVNEDVDLMSDVKVAYTTHLEDLIVAINRPDLTRSDEVEAVNSTITNLSYSSINLNSIDNITQVLSNSNLEEMHNLGVAIATYDEEQINTALDSIASYVKKVSGSQRQSSYEQLVDEGFQLVDNERLEDTDELYQVFTAFKTNLATAIADNNYNTAIEEVVSEAKADLASSVKRQVETLVMANYLEERLIAIFELPNTDTPVNPPIPDVPGIDEDPSKPSTGGGGHGDTIYPGDDIFYDPDEGLVPYYEVISKYSAYIEGLVQDGVISEELANYYIEYFNNLYQADEGNE